MMRWYWGVAQELIQVKAHSKRCQALHVRTMNKLVSTNHMGLKARRVGDRLKEQS